MKARVFSTVSSVRASSEAGIPLLNPVTPGPPARPAHPSACIPARVTCRDARCGWTLHAVTQAECHPFRASAGRAGLRAWPNERTQRSRPHRRDRGAGFDIMIREPVIGLRHRRCAAKQNRRRFHLARKSAWHAPQAFPIC